jgi:hypothetical protein
VEYVDLEHESPVVRVYPEPVAEQDHNGTLVFSYLMALVPILGLATGWILGIVVAARPWPSVHHHGWKIMATSLIATLVWVAVVLVMLQRHGINV